MQRRSPVGRFELTRDAPPAWGWEKYASWLSSEWSDLLDSGDSLDERPFRQFLARHPCLLPGGDGGGESFGGHHGAWNETAIAEPTIPGLSKRFPDFMWLTKSSDEIIPVLIEIEAPGKPWFNSDGKRSAKLAQAQDQLAEWQATLDNPNNRQQLGELYDFPRRWTHTHTLAPRYMLIYGRRAEFEDEPALNQKRAKIRGANTELMTFDRLRPLPGSWNAVSVRSRRGKTRVGSIPPTFKFGPRNAEAVATHGGWDKAIQENDLITTERREFLLSRLPYWQGLGREVKAGDSLGIHGFHDWE